MTRNNPSPKFWDPLRRKSVAATPEEQVRQWFIGKVLRDTCGVPLHKMMSEVPFRYGNKPYRADILIYEAGNRGGAFGGAQPIGIVECKRPDVELTAEVAEQALRYDAVLSVRWIFLTSGVSTLIFHRDPSSGEFRQVSDLPGYAQM